MSAEERPWREMLRRLREAPEGSPEAAEIRRLSKALPRMPVGWHDPAATAAERLAEYESGKAIAVTEFTRPILADADSGRRQREEGAKSPGARGRRKPGRNPRTGEEIPAPPDEVLRDEVDALRHDGESVTNARRRVAKKYGIPISTLRSRTSRFTKGACS